MTPKHKWYSLLVLLLLIGGLTSKSVRDEYVNLNKKLDIFSNILKELDSYYVDDVDLNAIVRKGINAMLATLDPYTSFLSEEDLENFKTLTEGAYGGIGALVGDKKGKKFVIMLYKDRPAHKGGLYVGDEIVQINGEDMTNRPLSHVSGLLKGMPDTFVQVAVKRTGTDQLLEFALNREQVLLKNVPYYEQITPGVGYIKLANFTAHAADEVKAALEDLQDKGAQKLILDLRGNPGGILDEAINVANLFISQHLPIVVTKGRLPLASKTYTASKPTYDQKIPIVALIDGNSASASEIVAGVIQDYDRGVLIGKSTYGKGLVQSTRPLSHNTQLKLTISKYYIPSGRSIHKMHQHLEQAQKPEQGIIHPERQAFKTSSGRTVYEGDGITPDIEMAKLQLAPITASLLKSGLLFDYATIFQTQNEYIKPPKDFSLSSKEYERFISWLKDKDYRYSIEPVLKQLLKRIQSESYTDDIKKQALALEEEVQHQKAMDLQKFKPEIKLLLQQEIIMRYYFQEGALEAILPHDQAVQKACTILQDAAQYDALLKATA